MVEYFADRLQHLVSLSLLKYRYQQGYTIGISERLF